MRSVIFFSLVFTLISCSLLSCRRPVDLSISPAEINHNRLIMSYNIDSPNVEVGIIGITDYGHVYVRHFDDSTIEVSGQGSCEGYYGIGVKGNSYAEITLPIMQDSSICLYAVTVTTPGFDAPAIGKILYRKFDDPNFQPLKIKMNGVIRNGVNWITLKEDKLIKTVSDVTIDSSNTLESREIILYPSDKTGKLIINGCGISTTVQDYELNEQSPAIQLLVDDLYEQLGNMDKDCVFNITVNNDNFVKESATILVNVYKAPGAYLASPSFSDTGKSCFEFIDPNLVGISVNGTMKFKKKLCVNKSVNYIVEGVTSKHRVFYGLHNGTTWDWVK